MTDMFQSKVTALEIIFFIFLQIRFPYWEKLLYMLLVLDVPFIFFIENQRQ